MPLVTFFLRLSVITVFFLLISTAAFAENKNVVSENLIHLQDDGKSYLLHRTMRTDWPAYDFHVDKNIALDSFYYIYPNDAGTDLVITTTHP